MKSVLEKLAEYTPALIPTCAKEGLTKPKRINNIQFFSYYLLVKFQEN